MVNPKPSYAIRRGGNNGHIELWRDGRQYGAHKLGGGVDIVGHFNLDTVQARQWRKKGAWAGSPGVDRLVYTEQTLVES